MLIKYTQKRLKLNDVQMSRKGAHSPDGAKIRLIQHFVSFETVNFDAFVVSY